MEFETGGIDGEWLRPRQRKRAPVRKGVVVSKFNPNIPGRRRLASTKDGHWLVFADTNSNGDFFFLLNEPLQFKVNLPHLDTPLEKIYKCLIVGCGIDGEEDKIQVCRYKICLLYACRPYYFWTSNNLDYWQRQDYSYVPEEFYLDAVLSESDDDDIAGRLFGITPHGLLRGPNLQMQLPNNSMLYNSRLLVFSEEGNRLFLVERKPQTSWEVWEIDINQGTWVRANMDGMVILINCYELVMFSTCMLKPGLLEGNCIVFVTKDRKTLHVHSLADQTCTVFENKPDSGFPVWYPNARKNGVPWWSVVEDDLRETATSQEPDKSTSNEITPLCSDERGGLINFYHNLPRELQSHIAESINSAMEYANFRLVCKKWSEIARPIRWIPDSRPEPAQSPWLMLFQENKLCSCIIDLTCNMKYYMRNRELVGCKIRYSKDGWLLVTKGAHEVFFFEPFSNTRISLPDIPKEYFYPDGMSMSSSPTSSGWVIISTVSFIEHLFVMYLRSVDKKWSIRRITLNVSRFYATGSNPVFHNHKFYYLASNGDMAVFWWELDVFKYHVIVTAYESGPLIKCGFTDRGYLVSREDKYLCLVVCPPSGNDISVFLLEAVNPGLTYDTSRWKKIKRLGNFSYFISHTSSFALPVSKGSQQQNTINFPLFVENRHLSYKLDTREFRYCNSSGDYIVSTAKPYERNESVVGTWIQPKVTRGYRL